MVCSLGRVVIFIGAPLLLPPGFRRTPSVKFARGWQTTNWRDPPRRGILKTSTIFIAGKLFSWSTLSLPVPHTLHSRWRSFVALTSGGFGSGQS